MTEISYSFTRRFSNSKLKTFPKTGDLRELQQLIDQLAEVAADGLHVILCFAEGGDSAVAEDVAGAGVVGGQRVGDVAVEAFELRRQVADGAFHVLVDVEGVGDAELLRGAGHELAQPASTAASTEGRQVVKERVKRGGGHERKMKNEK